MPYQNTDLGLSVHCEDNTTPSSLLTEAIDSH